jgi:hypothetical protein
MSSPTEGEHGEHSVVGLSAKTSEFYCASCSPRASGGEWISGRSGSETQKDDVLQRVALCFRAFSDEQECRFGNRLPPWAALPQDFFPQWLSSHTVFRGRTVQAPTEMWVMDIIFLEQLSPTL